MLIQLAAKLWLGPQQIDPSLLCCKRRSILRLIIVVYNHCKTKFVIKKLIFSMKNSHQNERVFLQYNVAFKKCKKNSRIKVGTLPMVGCRSQS